MNYGVLNLDKKTLGTRVIVSSGILTAISIILTRFLGVMVPILGIPALRISFGSIPIYISGMLFGPLAGALTGISADLIGYMMNPMGGAYFPGFTLSAALKGIIPGIIYMLVKSEKIKPKFNILNVFAVSLMAIGVIKALFLKQILHFENGMIYYYENKLSFVYIILYFAIVSAYILIPYFFTKLKKYNDSIYTLNSIFFMITLISLTISVGLNTLWLSMLFNKGFLLFFPVRIISSFITIPIDVFIIASFMKITSSLNFD